MTAQPNPAADAGTAPAVEISGCRLQLGWAGAERVSFVLSELRIAAGERIALTGPSGCGKSTLLGLVSGLLVPDAGSVRVLGVELAQLATVQRDTFRGRQVGYIYQSFNLLAGFNALENVLLGLRFGRAVPHRTRRARAAELLTRVGLGKRLHARPAKLSVGERQRVAIARALANRPALLLADEPTGSLDPATAGGVYELILELCAQERCTLLFVTHDPALAARLPRRFDCQGLIEHQPALELEAKR